MIARDCLSIQRYKFLLTNPSFCVFFFLNNSNNNWVKTPYLKFDEPSILHENLPMYTIHVYLQETGRNASDDWAAYYSWVTMQYSVNTHSLLVTTRNEVNNIIERLNTIERQLAHINRQQ